MQTGAFLAAILLAAVVSAVLSARRRRATLRRQLEAEWGAERPARPMDDDAMEGIRQCYQSMPKPQDARAWVDEITWNDLDMDAVFRYLNRAQSGVGEETLYRMLHAVDASGDTLQTRERWMNALSAQAAARFALQKRLRTLPREHEHGAFAFLADPQAAKPAHAWVYFALAAVPFACAGLAFANPLWLAGIGASLLINAIVYYRTKQMWTRELAAVRHLGRTLYCARKLLRCPVPGMEDGFAELRSLCAALKPLARWNGMLYMQRVNDLDFITDYVRIAFQLDMISLTRLSAFMKTHAGEVLRLYLLVGELDACAAVASVRKSMPRYAVPVFHAQTQVLAEGAAHPLLRKPVPNTLDWRENVLVTGSNASGKSTFIKAVAVNAILAQSVCTCWADSFHMPRAQVMSSMALRDNVQGGESYFIVEIKSLKRILAALRPDMPTLCFIDEILRGTNTAERIAASTALLRYLAGQNALCIAATHDMELARLLPGYRQVHFREEITPQGMVFPYTMHEGVSATRNAIRLLAQMGFPAEVTEAAERMAAPDAQEEPKANGQHPNSVQQNKAAG